MTAPFVEVIDQGALQARVAELGREITGTLAEDDPVVVGVLKGSVPFLTDLTRHLPLTVEIDFLNLTRFGREGRVSIAMDLSVSVEGRGVLIVEDIVDTGHTLNYLIGMLESHNPASVKTCALVRKAERAEVDVDVDYLGFDIPDKWVVGYGLDYAEQNRTLPYIGTITPTD